MEYNFLDDIDSLLGKLERSFKERSFKGCLYLCSSLSRNSGDSDRMFYQIILSEFEQDFVNDINDLSTEGKDLLFSPHGTRLIPQKNHLITRDFIYQLSIGSKRGKLNFSEEKFKHHIKAQY